MGGDIVPFFVIGPTASGKTEAAIRLAREWDGEVINADAFQLYRDLPIITASPTSEEQAQVVHHLYGVLSPAEEMDAARYAQRALEAIREVQSRGKRPIVVGGSGLYIKALTHGLNDLPSDAALRARLEALPLADKVAQLRSLDPVGAEAMNLTNARYVERALELCLLTGRPASELKTSWAHPRWTRLEGMFLHPDRTVLHERINRRVERMIAAGAIAEVERVRDTVGFSATSGHAIGVPDILAHLDGQQDLATTLSRIQAVTRQLAKRQLTWFRKEVWAQQTDS